MNYSRNCATAKNIVSYKLRTEHSSSVFAHLKLKNVSAKVFSEYEVRKKKESEAKISKRSLKYCITLLQ